MDIWKAPKKNFPMLVKYADPIAEYPDEADDFRRP